MTPKEFYQRLSTLTEKEVITLSPGPIKIIAYPADALAAKMVLWLLEQLPEDATEGDAEDVIDMAKWWIMFWHMLHQAEKQLNADEATQQELPL